MTTPDPTEAECNALLDEYRTAYRVTVPEGAEMQGRHLARYRRLPPKERAYFAALTAPYHDPHVATRTGEVDEASDGAPRITYTPPYPTPCACKRPTLWDWQTNAVRCSRCLHAWRLKPSLTEYNGVQTIQRPIIDHIDRKDMGHAIERRLPPDRVKP